MAGNRYYKVNEEGKKYRVPGVTTVLKQIGWGNGGLLYWANKQGLAGLSLEEARQEATGVGKRVHEVIECMIRREKIPICDWLDDHQVIQVEVSVAAFERWCDLVHFNMVRVEEEIVSNKYDCGGRVDMIARIDGSLCVVDWKTSNALYANTLCQVAAYADIYTELTGYDIDECHVLRIGKDDGSFHHHAWSVECLEPALDAFHHALRLYKIEKEIGKMI